MNREDLFQKIKQKGSYLCVGLDPDIDLLPKSFSGNLAEILDFNRKIIDATQDLCIAYKPNTAFYEGYGEKGWELLLETLKLLPKDHFIIVDAKRGDIGNTSKKYADAFFNPYHDFRVDAITINPYMGMDSVQPFIQYEDKWGIVLALTSNSGSQNFQMKKLESGKFLYEEVLDRVKNWGNENNIMFVVGATQAESIQSIRKIVPDHFLLIPGIGAQGGDLEKISEFGLNSKGGLIVNASRSILYASSGNDFAEKARESAQEIQKNMEKLIFQYLIHL